MASSGNKKMPPSFVTELLASAGSFEKEDLTTKLEELSKRIEEVKIDVFDALEKRYEEFHPDVKTADHLHKRVTKLSTEMNVIDSKIQDELKSQLSVSATEFQDLAEQLAETKAVSLQLDKLVKLHDLIQECNKAIALNQVQMAAQHLKAMTGVLEELVNHTEGLHIMHTLNKECQNVKYKLLEHLYATWDESIKWNWPTQQEQEKNGWNETTDLDIINIDGNSSLCDVIQAMEDLNILKGKLQCFGDILLDHFVKAALTDSNIVIESSNEGEFSRLTMKQGSGNGKDTDDKIVTPIKAFHQLESIFAFLNQHLFNLHIRVIKNENESVQEKITVMSHLGQLIGLQFFELVIQKCLTFAIPSSNSELMTYSHTVPEATALFQNRFAEIGFISKNDRTLTDFVGDVNVLFVKKKSQEIFTQARTFMTSELHHMVQVDNSNIMGSLRPLNLEGGSSKKAKATENINLPSEEKLSTETFRFPSCQISAFAQQLVRLAYETLNEAVASSNQCAVQLFFTVRTMFEEFCIVVPTFHKDSLTTLPQLTALHHNNCMYLAHHLLTLGHQFRPKLPKCLDTGACTFVDLVPKLRRLGTESFAAQMVHQRNALLECVGQAHGFLSVSEDNNYLQAERAINQALFQLYRLSRIWAEVLPSDVFHRSVGTLFNSLLTEVMNQVIALDDISAADAAKLHSLLFLLANKGPALLGVESEQSQDVARCKGLLLKYVTGWSKLQELMLVLNGGLMDISDRWADGKGPLANEMTANEVKQLIRALFQNTDRRSNVLAKIC